MCINHNTHIFFVSALILIDIIFTCTSAVAWTGSFDLIALLLFSIFRLSFLFWFFIGFISDLIYNSYFGVNSIFYCTINGIIYYFVSKMTSKEHDTDFGFSMIFYLTLVFNIIYIISRLYRSFMSTVFSDFSIHMNFNFSILCIMLNNILFVYLLNNVKLIKN